MWKKYVFTKYICWKGGGGEQRLLLNQENKRWSIPVDAYIKNENCGITEVSQDQKSNNDPMNSLSHLADT